MKVYVLNKEGEPLMPTKPVVARLLLKDNKAKVVRKEPFTIKMLIETTEYRQDVTAGMDTGSKKLGCAAITNGEVVYQSEARLRDDIKRRMTRRRNYRRTRRNRLRYREPRFDNRNSQELSPSLRSKVNSHLREKKFVESILPVTKWKVELSKFNIHKISNPDINKWEYQNGNMKGYYNTKAYILDRDDYTCQECEATNTKLHVHHIVYRSNGGTDNPKNLITLCLNCHEKVHNDEISIKGSQSKTLHATHMGIVKSYIEKEFDEFEKTYGYETKFKREQIFNLPKEHYFDAVAICCAEGEVIKLSDVVYKKRHIAKGRYRQTRGKHSERELLTNKIYGLRLHDYINTEKGKGFIKSKRRSGGFRLGDIDGNTIKEWVNVKRNCERLSARSTELIERREAFSALEQVHGVYNA